MKAAVVHEFGRPLVIEDRPIPEPGPGQITVRMEASGLCHTDIHAAHGDWPVKPTPPFVPGHEGVGLVHAVGDGVTSLRGGERVAVPWLGYACGTCRFCLTGWETLCGHQQNTGYSVDGCYAADLRRGDHLQGHPAEVLRSHGGADVAVGLAVDDKSFETAYRGLRRGGRLGPGGAARGGHAQRPSVRHRAEMGPRSSARSWVPAPISTRCSRCTRPGGPRSSTSAGR